MFIYAPLFSVLSQYLGAEKTTTGSVLESHMLWKKLTGDASTVVLDLVTFHPHLMASDDGVESIGFTKPLRHIWPKLQTHPTLARPSSGRRLWICPEHLHHQTGLARLPLSMPVQLPYVVERGLVVREKATM